MNITRVKVLITQFENKSKSGSNNSTAVRYVHNLACILDFMYSSLYSPGFGNSVQLLKPSSIHPYKHTTSE